MRPTLLHFVSEPRQGLSMRSSDVRPLTLTLLLEQDFIVGLLTDGRTVGRSGRRPAAPALLAELHATSARLHGLQTLADAGHTGASATTAQAQAREIGGLILQRCLPESIQRFLFETPLRALDLQLGEELAGIAWEAAFNGHDFLGHKFFVTRHLVQETPPAVLRSLRVDRDQLRVLVLHRGSQDKAADKTSVPLAQRLARRLAGIEGLSVSLAAVAELERHEILHRIENSDVVHYVGPLPAHAAPPEGDTASVPCLALQDIAALGRVPALLLCHATAAPDDSRPAPHHQLAVDAARLGLSLLVCPSETAFEEDRPDFVGVLYRSFVQGHSLGRAIREATMSSSEADYGNCGPRHAVYADAALVLAPTAVAGLQENSHRQVTIMSYDLVGSTKLLETMGPERYSEVLDQYHARCARIVTRWGGMASNPQGSDGIMCYFGLPVAHEHSALQSIRAATEILRAVAELSLQVRIGVVTGPVVVRAGQPVGVSIHLAARLQSIAEPGSVVFSESTYRLVQHRFEGVRVNNLPQLKGFEQPGSVYRLVGEKRQVLNPFDIAPRVSPFVAREDALDWLQTHWRQAAAAASNSVHAVVVWGGAGIGKSRLVGEFKLRHVARPQLAVECRCTPEHTQSAFHPLIDLLLRQFRIIEADPMAVRQAKIEAGLATFGATDETPALADAAEVAQVVAALLSVTTAAEAAAQPLQYSAEKQRQRTLEVLVGLFTEQARKAPLCLVFEDVHWLDPSSREFIKLLVHHARGLPLLVLMTQREEATAPDDLGFAVQQLELKGLSAEAARSLIVAASGDASVSGEVIGLLTEKADGVPLFIEESTRMVVDLQAAGGGALSSLRLAVPGTIQDLLMARLDRLGDAKPLAQLGSVIGREFSLALVQAILGHASAPIRTGQLQARLNALVASGLMLELRGAAGTNYFFKHALVRDAAYQSLWERDRRRFHLAIALVLSEQFPELIASQPEMAARHYAGAALPARAIEHWERAARLSLSRSAHEEAITHLNNGLALVGQLPVDEARDRAELRLQLLLAAQLIATEGYGAEQVGVVYQRAAELCRASGDDAALLKVQLGLEGYYFMRADFEQAHVIATQVAGLVAMSPDPMRRLQSTWALGNVLFHQGELLAAVERMDACLADYRLVPRGRGAVQDPGLMCLCYSAVAKWELGHPDEALQRARAAVALSAELKHKFSAGEAYGFLAMVQYFRGEFEDVLQSAAKAVEICEEGGFAVWLAHAKLLHGRARAALGEAEEGIAEMADGYSRWVATGAMVTRGFYLVLRAEGLALAGRPDEGLALLRVAMDVVTRCGERYYEAEIRRLMGELTLQQASRAGRNADAEAQEWFAGALALAQEKHMASLSLRAAMSLAALWTQQRRPNEARLLLQQAFEAVEDGHHTHDMRMARAMLQRFDETVAAEQE
jgi:class 3 adenylate cyclase/predicted ATPase